MTKRETWIARARIAGYHDDARFYTRLLIVARVNRSALAGAFASGKAAREAGIPCGCFDCARAA
jgi:hypothetical protein